MATARALGAEVWAVGSEPDLEWRVTLPGSARARSVPDVTPAPASSERASLRSGPRFGMGGAVQGLRRPAGAHPYHSRRLPADG